MHLNNDQWRNVNKHLEIGSKVREGRCAGPDRDWHACLHV